MTILTFVHIYTNYNVIDLSSSAYNQHTSHKE